MATRKVRAIVEKKFDELGSTGLRRSGKSGWIEEEFIRDLKGDRGRKVYREMSENDSTIGAMKYGIDALVRKAPWQVQGPDEEQAEFVDQCFGDMSHTFQDLLSEILSMIVYGFSWHEIVYKRRNGPKKDGGSRFSDGRIGWRKMPIRSQDTLSEWEFDDEGGVQSFVQVAPPTYQRVVIPIQRSLLFRVGVHKNSPEGRSLLRAAYRDWFMKKRVEEFEVIGVERGLAGYPVMWLSGDIAKQTLADGRTVEQALREAVTRVKRDEQEGMVLPLAYDEKGNKLVDFTLMSSPGNNQDSGAIIDRKNRSIAGTVFMQMIFLGQSKIGTQALSVSQTELFITALEALLENIAEVFNRFAIPRLLALNAMNYEEPPRLVPGKIQRQDLKELGAFLTAIAGAGVLNGPDEELDEHCRKVANLPPRPEDAETFAPPEPKPAPSDEPEPKPLPEAEDNPDDDAEDEDADV